MYYGKKLAENILAIRDIVNSKNDDELDRLLKNLISETIAMTLQEVEDFSRVYKDTLQQKTDLSVKEALFRLNQESRF